VPTLGYDAEAGKRLEDFEVLEWRINVEVKGWIQHLNIRLSRAGVYVE
jgi:hypothetical protein